MTTKACSFIIVVAVVVLLVCEVATTTDAFSPQSTAARNMLSRSLTRTLLPHSNTRLHWFNNNDSSNKEDEEKPSQEEKKAFGFLKDFQGMMDNFDDVIDDFVYKRMGAGEQWYGKRKYNPSGRVDGKYNGMGQTDQFRIELARVQKEEMEKRRERRLAEEEEERRQRQMK
ncbi:MAG: hypothetical protein SGBAC_004326 [Bacillariaceae sp.]